MCGIVGGVAQRDVIPILVEGLRRLEYRGYDSAGLAVVDSEHRLKRVRMLGKVQALEQAIEENPICGAVGIAHTRWATHGQPSTRNAHPHVSNNVVALVHNGIIENHAELRERQRAQGYEFTSETDTEVVVHQVHAFMKAGKDLLEAVFDACTTLKGAYALAIIATSDAGRMVVARRGSPLVIGIGIGEHFIASDVFALLPVTQRFMFLEEGDVAEVRRDGIRVFDETRTPVHRRESVSQVSPDAVDKSGYRHYMLKEINTQPRAVADTLEGRIAGGQVVEAEFGNEAPAVFQDLNAVHIVACGTSYHAGLVSRYWMEGIAMLPCSVEIASEFRYRKPVVLPKTLFVAISQSGETADTLAALRQAKTLGYAKTLVICNVPESSLTREADLVFLTRAGPEIGVASTKAFTTQLTAMLLLTVALARRRGLAPEAEAAYVRAIEAIPGQVNHVLQLNDRLAALAEHFVDKHHALFLGRGALYPVAMEGALKLKEISYIHAESYAAGELKHGPLALVDEDMPVIAVAPNNELLEKLKSNLEEVRERGGILYVFADPGAGMQSGNSVTVIDVAPVDDLVAPVIYTIPLQLLAYHVAVLKGADVDQPRNLAKSVTVE